MNNCWSLTVNRNIIDKQFVTTVMVSLKSHSWPCSLINMSVTGLGDDVNLCRPRGEMGGALPCACRARSWWIMDMIDAVDCSSSVMYVTLTLSAQYCNILETILYRQKGAAGRKSAAEGGYLHCLVLMFHPGRPLDLGAAQSLGFLHVSLLPQCLVPLDARTAV